jgi:hypothetical protein
MNPTPEEHWKRLAAVARSAPPAAPPARPDRQEIRRKLDSLQETLRHLFLTWLWRRWSLAAIVLAALAYLTVYLVLKQPDFRARPELRVPAAP